MSDANGWFSWWPCCARYRGVPLTTECGDTPQRAYAPSAASMATWDTPPTVALGVDRAHTHHPDREQYIYVVRHGEREDAVNEQWVALSDRPYDPPLTAEGRCQAREAGRRLAALPDAARPEVLVTSPFLRCLQTAVLMYNELAHADDGFEGGVRGSHAGDADGVNLEEEVNGNSHNGSSGNKKHAGPREAPATARRGILRRVIVVDPHLGEVNCPSVLKHDRQPVFSSAKLERDIAMFLDEGVVAKTVCCLSERVPFPEPRGAAMQRYDTALARYNPQATSAVGGAPRLNVAMITHGEAVGRSVTACRASAVVYNVDYCAFTTRRSAGAAHAAELLCSTGDSGVHWSEEMNEE